MFDTNGNKLVSMPENDTVPSLNNMLIEKAYWLYFCIWYDNGDDNFLSGSNKNNPDTLKEIYQSDYCITLDELPDWKNYEYQGNTETTGSTEETNPDIGFIPGDVNADEKVNVFDSIALRRKLEAMSTEDWAIWLPLPSRDDTNGDGYIGIDDLVLLNQWLVKEDVELTYYKPAV